MFKGDGGNYPSLKLLAYTVRSKPRVIPSVPFKTGAQYKKLVPFSVQERLIWQSSGDLDGRTFNQRKCDGPHSGRPKAQGYALQKLQQSCIPHAKRLSKMYF
jgi:hypothetical protein